MPIADMRPLEDVVDASVASARLTMLLLALFGILAVTLGAVGIYGVMAYGVTQRLHEIGVRIASAPPAATDPVTFLSVAAGLGPITLLASWIPARRAMRVDPLVTLR